MIHSRQIRYATGTVNYAPVYEAADLSHERQRVLVHGKRFDVPAQSTLPSSSCEHIAIVFKRLKFVVSQRTEPLLYVCVCVRDTHTSSNRLPNEVSTSCLGDAQAGRRSTFVVQCKGNSVRTSTLSWQTPETSRSSSRPSISSSGRPGTGGWLVCS